MKAKQLYGHRVKTIIRNLMRVEALHRIVCVGSNKQARARTPHIYKRLLSAAVSHWNEYHKFIIITPQNSKIRGAHVVFRVS